MEWIKFSVQKPNEDERVMVKFNNGKEIEGIRSGVYMSYAPNDLAFEDIQSGEKEWKKFNA